MYQQDGVYRILSLLSRKDDIYQILDPMTTIFKLCLLNFKDDGTKISIESNHIVFQEPGILQGIARFVNGDQREDLHKLNNPIKKSLEWYSNEKNETPNYSFIFKIACKGMEKLQKQYDVGTVKVSLDHYINMIEDVLKTHKIIDEENIISEENALYSEFKQIWCFKEIQILCDIMKIIDEFDVLDEQRKYYIKSIESILKGKDIMITNIITKMNAG